MDKTTYNIEEYASPEILKLVLDKIIADVESAPSPAKLLQRSHWLQVLTTDLTGIVEKEKVNGYILENEDITDRANFYLGEIAGNLSRIMQGITEHYSPISSLSDPDSREMDKSLGIPRRRIEEMIGEMNAFLKSGPKAKHSVAIQKCSQIAKNNKEYGFLVYAYTNAQCEGNHPFTIFGIKL